MVQVQWVFIGGKNQAVATLQVALHECLGMDDFAAMEYAQDMFDCISEMDCAKQNPATDDSRR